MINTRLKIFLRIIAVIGLVMALAIIRLSERNLFYDPVLDYFKQPSLPFPTVDIWRHFFSILLRYALNTILSCGIIWFLFQNRLYLTQSLLVFCIAFALLAPIYFLFIFDAFSFSPMLGFYVRRFLIQPLIGIILMLAFYYVSWQSKTTRS